MFEAVKLSAWLAQLVNAPTDSSACSILPIGVQLHSTPGLDSGFHPSEVSKMSTSFGWGLKSLYR